jgi:hypothetical protein
MQKLTAFYASVWRGLMLLRCHVCIVTGKVLEPALYFHPNMKGCPGLYVYLSPTPSTDKVKIFDNVISP